MAENIEDRINYHLDSGVVRIELAHATAANSLDRRMARAFRTAAERAATDVASGVARVVVLGAQGRVFSVGGDLSEFAAAVDRGAEVRATADDLHAALTTLRELTVPLVSVINGTAAGGGLGLALAGDIIVAAAEARIVMAYTASGLTPDCGLSWVLPRRLSWPQVMDLTLANRVLTGVEAADWGLVSRAVPREELDTAVEVLVTALRNGPAGALADAKRLVHESRERTIADQMCVEAATLSHAITQPDGVEGVDAFLAKRQPVYQERGESAGAEVAS